MKLRTMPLAFKYCLGQGIEIGASRHNPFDLPNCRFVATCDGVNYLYPQDLKDYQAYLGEQAAYGEAPLSIDMLGDFQALPVDNGSLNYIITSHVIEHVPNLFGAMVESDRVLGNGGVFMCLFPKRTAEPTDATRPLTTLDEMKDAWQRRLDMSKMPHEGWRQHYLVFSLQSMLRAINHINREGLGNWIIECVEETDSKVGNGHTIVLRKYEGLDQARWQTPDHYNTVVNQLVENREFAAALSTIKVSLSYDFFDATKLYIAAMLSIKTGEVHEGVEFLRQSLVVNPENERYRQEYRRITGTHYINPVL